MSTLGAKPIFVDTAAFLARFYPPDQHHDEALAVFDGIRSGEYVYRPLYTSRYVLSELVTLLNRRAGHDEAARVLRTIRDSSSFTVLTLGEQLFDRTCDRFETYDDQQISFVDHTSAVLADHHDIDHVFTFDSTDFSTLGFIVVPRETGEV
ncbi:type II toxin-antitoxin system VapC family toxin [Halosimplex pelagicum]|uniref:Type II toxin-antitoxin system VapC family toxin n=1 Tax=Halosimplex pelagicum TaxID=869886 RepID=A0A7D5STW5_9EURY|nr:PIN domain-containing protein [Halosimplex pelagicum]QLH80827.1 type II toxin-antitoxin system VapC family toxin [Halosimplex pelagicum]